MTRNIVIVYGPAGSGKTTFVSNFSKWCEENSEYLVAPVNFDPAVKFLPYKPIFDIRKYVNANKIMRDYNLGPNGAIIKAVDESKKYLNNLFEVVNESEYDYILLDTPGIMEVFTGRAVGREIIDIMLNRRYNIIGFFIMDSSIIKTPSEYIYFKTLYILSELKLGIPTIPVWNKISITSKQFKKLNNLKLNQLIKELKNEPGLYSTAAESLAKLVDSLKSAVRFLLIDSIENIGFNDVVTILHEVFCTCGDLT